MIRKSYWSASTTENAVLCDYHGDGKSITYALHPHSMPANPFVIAGLMNQAYEMGIKHAQAQVREAMGVAQ